MGLLILDPTDVHFITILKNLAKDVNNERLVLDSNKYLSKRWFMRLAIEICDSCFSNISNKIRYPLS